MTGNYSASLLIFDQCGRVIVPLGPQGKSLPKVTIEEGRVGICLSRGIREQLGLDVFLLVLPDAIASSLHCARLQSPKQVLPAGHIWSDPTNVPDFDSVAQLVANFIPGDTTFGRFSWYTEVDAWIGKQIARLGYRVRRLEQWNGRVGGVLLRVLTDGPDFWFKAVSDFNVREFGIAQLLAQRHPEHFPHIFAAEPRWNAILLEHVEGTELHECNDLGSWKQVASLLADVQMGWVGESRALLNAGAADLRPEAVTTKIPAFLDHVSEAMLRQEKVSLRPLSRDDLESLREDLQTMCAEVLTLPFAEGLANADFSPHNTLMTSRGPIFIDWAEACVSLPFIAGEYMWNRMVVEASNRKPWQDALRNVYLSRWTECYGKDTVDVAARLLPAFSVLAVAMFYHEREANGPSPYDAYLRSLTRRLQREVERLRSSCYATSVTQS